MQPNRQRAIDLLLAGWSSREVAAELGVDRATVWRWTQNPDFAAELARGRRERLADARARLDGATLSAVAVLLDLAADGTAPPAVRLRAACAVLDRTGMGPASRHELTGAGGGPVGLDLAELSRMTDDDLDRAGAALEKVAGMKSAMPGA